MINPDDIKSLTLQEKLLLMEAIWEDLSNKEELIEVPEQHKEVLDDREDQLRTGKAKFIDWEDAKREINEAAG